jgi:hypothetical protein
MKPFDDALALIDDYVRGHLPERDVEAFEDDLFARALRDETPELAFREGLGRTLREMKERGTLQMWLTERDLAELIASGARVRRFDLDLTHPTEPDFSGDFDILVTRVPMSFEGIEHLDAEVLARDGRVLKTMPDIAFERSDGAIYACCERELAIAAARSMTITRLWADGTGGRRLIAEFRPPGP